MSYSLDEVKAALDEHLSAINDTSSEIQALFDYIQQVEIKIDKIAQRVDQLQLAHEKCDKLTIIPLNQTEKKLFLVLYTEEAPLSFNEIAAKTNLASSLVPECISSLVHKGIPLKRSFFNNHLFFQIEKEFKERQAKENLVNLSLQSFME